MSERPDAAMYDLAEVLLERPGGLRSQVAAARAERLAIRFQEVFDDFIAEEAEDGQND